MEAPASQPPVTERYDHHLRTYNDATTWLAEVLDGSMRTPFEYTFDGRELRAEDGSELGPIFADALRDSERLRRQHPNLAFETRRRTQEQEEYHDMVAMMRGELPNTMVVVSDFPPELMNAHSDVGGYNVTRKQTMLRVLTAHDGRLTMYSQSLDGSNRQALEAIYHQFGIEPADGELLGQRIHADLPEEEQNFLTDRLTGVYDRSLAEQFGGQWYAGRPETRHDTYSFVRQQFDLVGRFVERELRGGIPDQDRYNIAALLSKRFEAFKNPRITVDAGHLAVQGVANQRMPLEWQLQRAGNEARAEGRTFSGCGASAGPDTTSAAEQLEDAGYGKLTSKDEDQYGSLTFRCKNGHTNRRPRGKLISSCWVKGCENSVAC